jgi:ankyrin repeat protein
LYTVDKGADINSFDARDYTPVCVAVQYGHLPLVAYLVSRGAKLDIPDKSGDTCLHWAAYKKHPDLTRLLIMYGVYPKTIDNFGQTVLHLACLGGNLNIVQQLIELVISKCFVLNKQPIFYEYKLLYGYFFDVIKGLYRSRNLRQKW